eukprot:6412274-Prymnesium_polylepis.2
MSRSHIVHTQARRIQQNGRKPARQRTRRAAAALAPPGEKGGRLRRGRGRAWRGSSRVLLLLAQLVLQLVRVLQPARHARLLGADVGRALVGGRLELLELLLLAILPPLLLLDLRALVVDAGRQLDHRRLRRRLLRLQHLEPFLQLRRLCPHLHHLLRVRVAVARQLLTAGGQVAQL